MLVTNAKIFTLLIVLCISACATLSPNFEEPKLSVSAFRILPSNGLPSFEIDLNIINPNSTEINLRGMSYTASIAGHKVVSGVANKIPLIPAYGEGKVQLRGDIDLFAGFQVLAELMQQRNTGINYTLNVKLDVGQFMPNIHILKEGKIIPPVN